MDGGDRRENNGKTIMKHVMLRFRPIAPKPVTDGSGYSDLMRKELMTKKRIKRKYVRVNNNNTNNNNKKKNVVKSNTSKMFDKSMETLELLPEIGKNGWWSSDLRGGVESWVSLECVTGGGDGRKLGCTDGEKVSCLEMDTCPGFVSERDGGVRWVNMAYKRMVGVSDPQAAAAAVVVWLVEKEKIPVGVEAFSCRVRVAYGGKWKVVPCDVWRMDGELGAFAWRLDIQAALSLGP